jgi:1,2-diacylglycerol 3-alpha-glucosyltransferase
LGMRATANLIKKYSSQERLSYSSLWWSHMVNMGNYADAVTVPSGHLRNSLVDAGVQTKVHHIPNGLTKSTYPGRILPLKKPNVMRIISVGRFSPEKRLDVLISTLAKLRFKAELIMVGDGPDFSAMEQLAAQNGLGRKVRFMGHLDNAAVRQLMKESDVFCLASYDFDNQPMVILEALDAGLPIVYCDHKLSEGLKPQNSLLTGRLPADFATALEKLKNDQLRRKMATASKQLAPDYDTAKVSARLLGVYQSAGARI